jgi:hypothetical protein
LIVVGVAAVEEFQNLERRRTSVLSGSRRRRKGSGRVELGGERRDGEARKGVLSLRRSESEAWIRS